MNKLVNRKKYLSQLAMWREEKMIKVITGIRRCGKSTLFELYIEQLKTGGVSDDQIIFVNLEDEDFSELLDHKKLHEYIKARILKDKWMYIFIDEIQNCKNYEKRFRVFTSKKTLIYTSPDQTPIFSQANLLPNSPPVTLRLIYFRFLLRNTVKR